MTVSVYENYGDANFFEGGMFIMDEGDGDYSVITCDYMNEGEEYLWQVGMICPTDDWIDLEAVKDMAGRDSNDDPFLLVADIVHYYGLEQAGGDFEVLNVAGVQERMNGYAKEYEFETDNWSAGPLYY